jgi:hypothetical protein
MEGNFWVLAGVIAFVVFVIVSYLSYRLERIENILTAILEELRSKR